MANTFSYAISRSMLDAIRGESVNIGLVVFREDGSDIRILPNMRKVQALDANVDIEHLYNLKADIAKWIQGAGSTESAHKLLQGFGGINVSDLGWFSAVDHDEYESGISRLMRTMVIPPAKKRRRKFSSRLQTEIRRLFERKNLIGKEPAEIERHLLIPHFPIGDALSVDFALKNGAYQVTETSDYRVSDERVRTSKLQETGFKAVTLDLARDQLGEDTKRVFLYAASSAQENLISTHLNLMSKYADRILNFESSDDRAVFFENTLSALGASMLGPGQVGRS